MIVDFQVEDKGDRPSIFQEIILMTNTKFEVILEMLFLKISNTNMSFVERTLLWKFYTTNKVLPTNKWVQLIDPKQIVIAALDAGSKTFVVYVAILEQEEIAIDPDKKAQIEAQSEI